MKGREVIERGAILVDDGKIAYVGKESAARPLRAERTIDAEGTVALPGMINCHTHLSMTILRGVAEDQKLGKWLRETVWPLEAKLKPEDVYHGALLGCLEMIRSGTTCFADMYLHEDAVVRAVKESGLRSVLAQGIIEGEDRARGEKMLGEAVRFARKYHGYADGRVQVKLGPHAVYTCSPELLAETREAASELGVGIHIHLAESKEMREFVKAKYGVTEVGLLDRVKFLGPDVLAAHCIYLSKGEIRLLAKRGVKVSYNPVANMKLAQGAARIKGLLHAGITVGIGTNGPASNNSLDMFESMKIATLLQKITYEDPTALPARKVLRMATLDAAKALGLERLVGSIEAGKRADLILVDFKKPHLTPVHDLHANLVYSARGSDVDTVIVDGKILMENREVKTLDEGEVIQEAAKAAFDLLSR